MSRLKLALCVALLGVVVTTAVAVAGGRSSLRAELNGYNELPLTLSTPGNGSFHAAINRSEQTIAYRLTYADTDGTVQQAHIHFGREFVPNGGVSAFLCSNLGNGPAGTQACPPAPATVTGKIRPADVIGPDGQGIAAGEFEELVRRDALRGHLRERPHDQVPGRRDPRPDRRHGSPRPRRRGLTGTTLGIPGGTKRCGRPEGRPHPGST